MLIEVISAQGLILEERAFTTEEAYSAREAFLTSASQVVLPVVRIDDRPIGNGAMPGSLAYEPAGANFTSMPSEPELARFSWASSNLCLRPRRTYNVMARSGRLKSKGLVLTQRLAIKP